MVWHLAEEDGSVSIPFGEGWKVKGADLPPQPPSRPSLDAVAAFQGCVQSFRGIRHGDKMRGGCGEGQREGRKSVSPRAAQDVSW